MISNIIEIWSRKFSTNEVLIASFRVPKTEYTYITFTKEKSNLGKVFRCKTSEVLKSEIVTNGKISCRAVPFSKFEEVKSV